MKKLFAVLLLLALSACASVPAEREACFAPEYEPATAVAQITQAEALVTYRELTAEERARFLKAWNESPPAGGFLYDTVGYFDAPGHRNVLVLFIERGCIWTHHEVPRAVFLLNIRGGVEG